MPTDVVLDLETMGIASDAAIVSIGAVSLSGAEFYNAIANPSGSLNAATVRWWMAQREEVRAVWLTDGEDEVAVLLAFGAWLSEERDRDGALRLWGSEDFDTAILKDAYARHNLPTPWHYRESRGLRTAFDLLGVDEDAHPWGDRIEHIAIDCARQAARLLAAALHPNGGQVMAIEYNGITGADSLPPSREPTTDEIKAMAARLVTQPTDALEAARWDAWVAAVQYGSKLDKRRVDEIYHERINAFEAVIRADERAKAQGDSALRAAVEALRPKINAPALAEWARVCAILDGTPYELSEADETQPNAVEAAREREAEA